MSPLKWSDCGPDLTEIPKADLDNLIRSYGEIRVRYAAYMIIGLNISNDAPLEDNIKTAVTENWQSPTTIRAIAAGEAHKPEMRVRIPWLDRYYPNPTDQQRKTIEELCYWNSMCTALHEIGSISVGPALIDTATLGLMETGLLGIQYHLHPDFEFDNVIRWLSLIVNGQKDPILQRAFDRYRPDLHISHHDTYIAAWDDWLRPLM